MEDQSLPAGRAGPALDRKLPMVSLHQTKTKISFPSQNLNKSLRQAGPRPKMKVYLTMAMLNDGAGPPMTLTFLPRLRVAHRSLFVRFGLVISSCEG